MKSAPKTRTLALGLITMITLAGGANAAVTVVFEEVGTSVVVSYSGSVDTSGLSVDNTYSLVSQAINPGFNKGFFSNVNGDFVNYRTATITGPDLGSGGASFTGSFSGDGFAVNGINQGDILLPLGYLSGSLFAGEMTFSDQSFSTLGITSGIIQNWSWGSGANADSMIVRTGPVPEPSAALLLGLGAFSLMTRRRRSA